MAYRTRGFSWKADYSLVLSQDETLGDIGGWVTIDNNSGKKYKDAKVKLIAGDVNVVQNRPSFEYDIPTAGGGSAVTDQSFADYHLYTLAREVTLNENSQKQV